MARPYVIAWQEKEPTRWKYIEDLFEILQEIEAEGAEKHFPPYPKWLDEVDLCDFVNGEYETWKSIQEPDNVTD